MKINIMYYNNCFVRNYKISKPNFLISDNWYYDSGNSFLNLLRMEKYENLF